MAVPARPPNTVHDDLAVVYLVPVDAFHLSTSLCPVKVMPQKFSRPNGMDLSVRICGSDFFIQSFVSGLYFSSYDHLSLDTSIQAYTNYGDCIHFKIIPF